MSDIPALTYDELRALSPCSDSMERVTDLLGGARELNGKKVDAAEARAAGCTFGDIIWAASSLARKHGDIDRRLLLFMADCAARVVHIYEKVGTSEAPRTAIIACRQVARLETNEPRAALLASTRDAAWRASLEVAGSAWGASEAAAGGSSAWYVAECASLAAAGDAAKGSVRWAAAVTAERAWQFDRLIARLSADEPEDWPLHAAPVREAE